MTVHVKEQVRTGSRLKSMQSNSFFHRTLATAWLIEQLRDGADVYGEIALSSNEQLIQKAALQAHYKKLPDGLVLHHSLADSGGCAVLADWLEVESAYKGPAELDKITELIWTLGTQLRGYPNVLLDRVIFLYSHDSAHEASIVRAINARLTAQPVDDPVSLFSSVKMVRAVLVPPLTILRFETFSLFEIMQAHSVLDPFEDYIDTLD